MTKELIGVELDAAVAAELGYVYMAGNNDDPEDYVMALAPGRAWERFQPSTDWSQGGPIIEREHIGVFGVPSGWGAIVIKPEYWDRFSSWDTTMLDATGPTPLIAAMRAYISSKGK